MADVEEEPLLSSASSATRYNSPSSDQRSLIHQPLDHRKLDDDVLPEASVAGRKIGWFSAYILVISRVIGSGIFAMPGSIVQNAGSPGLALLLWVIGAFVSWLSLAIDLEYGCMLPRSGGHKVYLEYTYRWPRFFASSMVASQAVLLGFTASNCIVFAKYTLYALDKVPSETETKLLAVALLSAITIIHSCFYKTGIWIQNILGWLKIILISFTCLTGIIVLIARPTLDQNAVSDGSWDYLFADSNWEWNSISTAFFKVFYSYAGLSNLNYALNEVKNPVRTLKTVAPTALLTACSMYVLINVAYLAVVPLKDVKASKELIAALFFTRLGFGKSFVPLAIALSAAGNVMVVTFSAARLKQEIARQGLLPFGKLLASNKPFGAPMGGFIIHYIPSFLVIVLPPASSVYAFIADVEGYAGQFFSIAVAAGLILLRSWKPDVYRPFRAWLLAPVIQILLSVSLILAPLIPSEHRGSDVSFFFATYAVVAVSVLLIGVAYWLVWSIILPKCRGYELREKSELLSDGTSVITFAKDRK